MCEEGFRVRKKFGFIPVCTPNTPYKCDDMGYVPCLGMNIGCGQDKVSCGAAIKTMVTAVAYSLTSFAISLVLPGASLILNALNLAL